MAVVAGRPFQIPLGMHEYDDTRTASDEVTAKRDTIAEHRRGKRANFAVSFSFPTRAGAGFGVWVYSFFCRVFFLCMRYFFWSIGSKATNSAATLKSELTRSDCCVILVVVSLSLPP